LAYIHYRKFSVSLFNVIASVDLSPFIVFHRITRRRDVPIFTCLPPKKNITKNIIILFASKQHEVLDDIDILPVLCTCAISHW